MKACVFSLGCKVNQYEGQAIIAALERRGYEAVDTLCPADLYVLNTCSVTAEADRKSRQLTARALKYNEKAKVVVVGCSSQNDMRPYSDKPQVIAVSGSGGKVKAVLEAVGGVTEATEAAAAGGKGIPARPVKTRGLIKIQDGCNNFCSYCIVPYLRGRSRSRPVADVLEEARADGGYCKEIVLTGVDLSAYGADIGASLSELCRALAAVPARKRLGSLECGVVGSELLSAMKEGGFCDHFHLSLQSGSDSVLKRMNRHYTADEYLRKVDLIRSRFPYAGITTDIIAGFPGESENEHKETLEFISRAGFSRAHVFPYSERQGTAAARMPQLPVALRRRRAAELSAAAEITCRKFLEQNSGRVAEVYFEDKYGDLAAGYTSNYIRVFADAPLGGLCRTTLKQVYKNGLKGELL